jgi:hypothetical protein
VLQDNEASWPSSFVHVFLFLFILLLEGPNTKGKIERANYGASQPFVIATFPEGIPPEKSMATHQTRGAQATMGRAGLLPGSFRRERFFLLLEE